MKRATPWQQSSSDDSSDSDSEDEQEWKNPNTKKGGPRVMLEEADAKKRGGMDLEALRRHGYGGGPSVLEIRPPKEVPEAQDWSWSNGKRGDSIDESYGERERTRAAANPVESELPQRSSSTLAVAAAGTATDKRSLSFKQKEKRKRDIGQSSRGKNYVEEEKRLLRDRGVYSGFDS